MGFPDRYAPPSRPNQRRRRSGNGFAGPADTQGKLAVLKVSDAQATKPHRGGVTWRIHPPLAFPPGFFAAAASCFL
jgi:hypothetical protein